MEVIEIFCIFATNMMNYVYITIRRLAAVTLTLLTVVAVYADDKPAQWCLKTDAGQYIEMARVVMLAAVDGQEGFEVVVREGQGATGVKSITFEMVVTDYTPAVISDEPPLVTETGPWCLISNDEDSVAMSRVQMLANVDGSNLFEVVTTDGANLVGVSNIRFGRGRSKSSGQFKEIDVGSGTQEVLANPNNPWVLITNQGDTIAMSRVTLLATADANDRFEIVTSDGANRTDVSFIRFAHGDTKDAGGFKSYKTSDGPEPLANPNNPWCLITEHNDTVAMSRVQMIANADAGNRFEIVTADGAIYQPTTFIRFAHGDSPTAGGFRAISGESNLPVVSGSGPWCMVTENNDSIAVGRVQMLANIDGNSLFEIVTKYGDGVSGVQSVYFTRGLSPLSGGFDPNYREAVNVKGDANRDGEINAEDVACIVEYMAGHTPEKFSVYLADANGDGVIDVRDIVAIVNAIFTGLNPVPLMTPVNNQVTLSSIGVASVAIVRDMDGHVMGEYQVSNGSVTINVSDYEPDAYLIEVGTKAVVFMKK